MELDCCVYRIKERTKNEYVAVGTNGDIIRWPETNGPEQDWVILPVGDNKYKILTCQLFEREKNECISVVETGELRRWGTPAHPAEQIFSFMNENEEEQGWCNIMEHTRNEYVAVVLGGRLKRWQRNRQPEQRFKLEPKPAKEKPKVRPGEYKPREIPDIPRLGSHKQPPKISPLYLIGEMVYPAFFVNDPKYRSKVTQVEKEPWYILRREQYWLNEYYLEFDGHTSKEETVRIKTGIRNMTSNTMENTVGMKMSNNYEMGFNVGFEVKNVKFGSTQNGSYSTEVSYQLKLIQATVREELREYEETVKVTFPAGKRFSKAMWILCDRFTIVNTAGVVIGQWEARNKDTIIEDSFPRI